MKRIYFFLVVCLCVGVLTGCEKSSEKRHEELEDLLYQRGAEQSESMEGDAEEPTYSALKRKLTQLESSLKILNADFELEVVYWASDKTTINQLKKDIDKIIEDFSGKLDEINNLDVLNDEWETYRESLIDLITAKIEQIKEYKGEVENNSPNIKDSFYYTSIEYKYMSKISDVFKEFINEVEKY